MGRITIDGERAQFSTKLEIHPDKWDNKVGRAKGNTANTANLNRLLDNIRGKASMLYNRLMDENGYVFPDKIKNALLGFEEKGKTIMFYFDKFNAQYKLKVGTMVTRTTYLRYELAKNRLADFLKEQKGTDDIPFIEINTVFLQDFYLFLRNTYKSGNNNAMKTMQHLRSVFNYIKNSGETFIDPFANFKMSFETIERNYLTQDELHVLYNKKFGSERLDKVRDTFIFSCYTGLSFSDICDLTKDNIKQGIDGNLWIMSKRHKTGIPFKVRLLDIPISIMEKYEGLQKDNKILPVISNQKMNSYLHEIANICCIDKKITFHVARNLHELSKDMKLDFFVLFSSISSLIGNIGQANYVAANSYLDSFALWRKKMGFTATVVNLGALAESGVVARSENLENILKGSGINSITNRQVLQGLDLILQEKPTQLGLFDLDWNLFFKNAGKAGQALFSKLNKADTNVEQLSEVQVSNRSKLLNLESDLQHDFITGLLQEQLGKILKISVEQVSPDKGINLLGVDSILTVELKTAIRNCLAVELPPIEFLTGPTLKHLSTRVIDFFQPDNKYN
jgi:integrase/acyl carrier protein